MDNIGNHSNRSYKDERTKHYSPMTTHRCAGRIVTFGTTDVIPHSNFVSKDTILWLPSAAGSRQCTVSSTKYECNKDKEVRHHHASTSMHRYHVVGKGIIHSDGDHAGVSEFRNSKRKLEMQCILLQQDIHRALRIHDPIAIAKLAAAYSMNARKDAFIRARMILEEVEDVDDMDSDSLSSCDDGMTAPNDCGLVQLVGMPLYSLFLRDGRHRQVDTGDPIDTKAQNISALRDSVPNER